MEIEKDICICHYPVWAYDKYNNEWYGLPAIILERMGITKQKGDIEFILERDGVNVNFIAVPFSEVGTRGIPVPENDIVYHDVKIGNDIVSKQFTKLTWQKPDGKHFKKYEVRDHYAVAGCEPSETYRESEYDNEGKEKEVLKCVNKDVFEVLHPIDEFINMHVLELEKLKIV